MEKITFKTKDEVTIVGNYFKSEKEHAYACLLLHQMPLTKENWNNFANLLQKKGYNVLAIDLRGHGESIDKNGVKLDYNKFKDIDHKNSIYDVESAKDFLKQSGADTSNFIIVGASIGANLALLQATKDKDVKQIILLSVGLDYRGLKTPELASKYSGRVYVVSSEGDFYSAESSRQLYKLLIGDKKLEIIDGKSHGTDMFLSRPKLMNDLINWING